jgi:hypothetical protein
MTRPGQSSRLLQLGDDAQERLREEGRLLAALDGRRGRRRVARGDGGLEIVGDRVHRAHHGLEGRAGGGIGLGRQVRERLVGCRQSGVQLCLELLGRGDDVLGHRCGDSLDRVFGSDDGRCRGADGVGGLLGDGTSGWERAIAGRQGQRSDECEGGQAADQRHGTPEATMLDRTRVHGDASTATRPRRGMIP